MKKITISYRPKIIDIEDYDEAIDFNRFASYDTEILILSFSGAEVQLLLLRYLGYNYKEIVKIMNLKNIGEFYSIWRSLRENVEKFNKSLV